MAESDSNPSSLVNNVKFNALAATTLRSGFTCRLIIDVPRLNVTTESMLLAPKARIYCNFFHRILSNFDKRTFHTRRLIIHEFPRRIYDLSLIIHGEYFFKVYSYQTYTHPLSEILQRQVIAQKILEIIFYLNLDIMFHQFMFS